MFGTLLAVIVGGFLTAHFAKLQWKRQTDREAEKETAKQERDLLLERLSLQLETLREYTNLLTKYQAKPSSGVGMMANIDARREQQREAHADTIRMTGKIAYAFGDPGFAAQAADLIAGIQGGHLHEELKLTIELQLGPAAVAEMEKAIKATQDQLKMPPLGYVPKLIDPKVYNEQKKRAMAHQLGETHGLDPKKIDEIFDAAAAKRGA